MLDLLYLISHSCYNFIISLHPRLIDDETFQKAQEIRLQTATKLGRVRPAKVRTVKAVNLNFTVGTIEKRFQDPYLQAQYAYEQIQEKIL